MLQKYLYMYIYIYIHIHSGFLEYGSPNSWMVDFMENPFQHGPFISISFSSKIYLHKFRYLYRYLHVFAFLHTNLHTSQQINVYFKKLKQYMCIHINTLKKIYLHMYIHTHTKIFIYIYTYVSKDLLTHTYV